MKKGPVNWEPDVRKALEQLNEGNPQVKVDELARRIREQAVSPLDLLAEGQGLIDRAKGP